MLGEDHTGGTAGDGPDVGEAPDPGILRVTSGASPAAVTCEAVPEPGSDEVSALDGDRLVSLDRFLLWSRSPTAVLLGMISVYLVVFGRLTWEMQSNFGTFTYDMGIFDQEIWQASRFGSTFLSTRGLSMWGLHVNPVVYLLVPFYWLGAGPHFLYVVQTVALASGAIPLWLLARDRFGDAWLSLGIPAAWLLYPALEWNNWWHFHPDCLAVTPLLFAWWFASRGWWWWYAAAVVIVLACKEDTALVVIALGIAVAVAHRRRAGYVTIGAAITWLFVCLKVIIPHATGIANPFYVYRFSELGNSSDQIVYNLVRHPSRMGRLAVRRDRRSYYWKLLAPVGGLALLAPLVLLISAPAILVNIANTEGYGRDIKFQYQLLVIAGLFLAVVEGVARHGPAMRRFCVGLLCAAALASNVAWSPSMLDTSAFHSGAWAKPSAHTEVMAIAVRMVPGNAGVSASYTITSHLTHRYHIYEWPNPFKGSYWGINDRNPAPQSNVDYLVLDTSLNAETAPLLSGLVGPGGQFQVVFNIDGVVVARRVRSPGGGPLAPVAAPRGSP